MALSTEPPTLDPARASDLVSMNVLFQLMRGLTQLDAQGQVRPALAHYWQQRPDGRQYVFHLRPEARWSDGQPITAQHVADGWRRALTPETASEYAFFLFDVVHAEAYFQGKLRDFSKVGLRVLDKHRLEVTLRRPVPFFLSLLAAPVTFPIRLDVIARHGEGWTEAGRFVGNGPYRLVAWRHEERLRLAPNPYYWDAPAKPVHRPTVELPILPDPNTAVILYESGGLDFLDSIPTFEVRRLRRRPDYHQTPLHAIYYLGFNTRKPPFHQAKARRAFAMAVDRRLFDTLLQGGQQPLQGWITPGLLGYAPQHGLAFNPPMARQQWQQAKTAAGKNKPLPSVFLGFRSQYDIQKEAEICQFLWQRHLQVPVRLNNQDWKVFLSQLNHDAPPLFRLSWYADYPDPDSFMSLFTSWNGNNHTGWHHPQYDAWVREAATTLDPARRVQLYSQAQHLLLNTEAVIIPLYTPQKGYLLRAGWQGVSVSSLAVVDLAQLVRVDVGH
jgi:oligopeptide transport system substrate-binding protein